METWVSWYDAKQHLEDAFGIEPQRAGQLLHVAARTGVRTRATTKGGKPLAKPELLPAALWAGPYINLLTPDTRGDCGGIQFCREDLLKWRPPGLPALSAQAAQQGVPEEPAPPAVKRRGGGRTDDFDWDAIFSVFVVMVYEGDVVESGAETARRLLDRLQKKKVRAPSEEYLAERVRRWLLAYRAEHR